jgi:NTP pyrophosphatase (non-canonical NTP hydrolase)
MALGGEVGELLALLQWLRPDEVEAELGRPDSRLAADLADEIADVGIYLLLLADQVGVDLINEINEKLRRNEARYPVEQSKGRRSKYNELEGRDA